MVKVLITGGNGFLGRQIVQYLQKSGHQIYKVERATQDNKGTQLIRQENIFYSDDLFQEKREWWAEKLRDMDIVILNAWYVKGQDYLNSKKNIDCLMGTVKILSALEPKAIKSIVGRGTSLEYKSKESAISPSDPVESKSLYAFCKIFLHDLIRIKALHLGIDYKWFRVFNLYGENEKKDRLVPYVNSCIELGEDIFLKEPYAIRDYLDVKDAGKQIAEIINTRGIGSYNVCSGNPISVMDLCKKILEESKSNCTIRHEDKSYKKTIIFGKKL